MPITNTDVVDGPGVQASGEHRGVLEFTFSDGRVIRRTVSAPDAAAWSNLIVDMSAEVEAQVALSDAQEGISPDQEIAANKEASIKQRALEYLRKAYSTGDPYVAFLLFDRFNNYRLAQGWSLNQVHQQLADAGLSEEEWDNMLERYQYLSNTGRVTAMQAYQDVVAGDTWGGEFR